MSQKVITIGSSHGVTLSKNVLQALQLQGGDDVSVEYNSHKKCIEIKPVIAKGDQIHMAQALSIIEAHMSELQKTND